MPTGSFEAEAYGITDDDEAQTPIETACWVVAKNIEIQAPNAQLVCGPRGERSDSQTHESVTTRGSPPA
jgi:hypothetical protein